MRRSVILKIQVNDNFLITSDTYNVVVNRKHYVDPKKSPNWAKMQAAGKSGEIREEWKEDSYHSSIEKALEWILDQQVRESDAESISELVKDIQAFKREIKAVLAS